MGGPAALQTIGRYRIYNKIGSGGMATVHLGRLVGGAGFSRTVAIKRLHAHLAEDPQFRSTLIDEARLAARIRHPNVVPTLDVVAAEGELLVVMEYVCGEALSRLLSAEAERERQVPPAIASAIVSGILHGLHAAHEATGDRGEPLGIVHRDVSPQNILVGIDGVARLIDFGVAKAAGRLQQTRAGAIKGKIPYMAREQLAARNVTRAADIYSMGVVLWETLTCSRLFTGDSDMSVIEQVQAGARDAPSRHAPNVSPALDELVMRALAREPEDRFATALEMAEQLLRIVPPAFPTAVGAWCSEVAREPLANRARWLAEIESQSGVDAAREPGGGPETASGVASDPVGDGGDPSGSGAPMLASQPSSLSVETPGLQARWRSRRPGIMVAAAGGGGALLAAGLGAAIWLRQARPALPRPPADMVVQIREDAGGVGIGPVDSATRPVDAGKVVDADRRKPDASRRVRWVSPPRPESCDPPWVLDSAGHRVYKPRCLH